MLSRRTALAIPLATPALAQQRFPNRAVRLVVPWLPGDSAGHLRVLAELSGRHLGQPVIIENRPGASGTLGPALIAQDPRGHGHLIGQMPMTIFRIPAMSRRPTFDAMTDFSWIIHLSGYVFGVVVRSDSQYRSWEDLLDDAKANPGRISYGSPGSAERAKRFPEVRTLREVGVVIVSDSLFGLAGPKNMDMGVIRALHDAIKPSLHCARRQTAVRLPAKRRG